MNFFIFAMTVVIMVSWWYDQISPDQDFWDFMIPISGGICIAMYVIAVLDKFIKLL